MCVAVGVCRCVSFCLSACVSVCVGFESLSVCGCVSVFLAPCVSVSVGEWVSLCVSSCLLVFVYVFLAL